MIEKSVVLILGAGASAPYGYPPGSGLASTIIKELESENTPFAKDVLACNFHWEAIKEFRDRFNLSLHDSVDAFLERRPQYVELGKVSIARTLIPFEKSDKLLNRDINDHWYRMLAQALDVGPERFGDNKVSIVTFNYDRSLEQYLFMAFKNQYQLSDDDAGSLICPIPIVHLHGDLGRLPVIHGNGRPYDPEVSPYILGQCAKGIKIISEDVAGDSGFRMAWKLIEEAETICFIGFGFHQTNLERLFESVNALAGQKVYGSAKGLTVRHIGQIASWFKERYDVKFEFNQFGARSLLGEYPVFS